jgi:CubicO group peptidase (beta-lactamase class C family)
MTRFTGRHCSISFGLVLCLVATPSARADAVDDAVKAEMAARKIPGLALAIVAEGKPVRMQCYGMANLEWNAAVAEDTIFQTGSVGKQFTASLVMLLVRDGKISLDDPIGKYFQPAPEIWKGIKVRHLLSHTAGISNKLYEQIDLRKDYTEDELAKKIGSIPLDFPPGSKWSYSNPGYVLLGILIHKATGTFYGDLLKKRIFEPAGMTAARIINEADIIPHRAAGYRLVGNAVKNQAYVSPSLNTTADGSLYVTIRDMVRWDEALRAKKLLTEAELEAMWTRVKLADGKTAPYGFGWAVGEYKGQRLIEHGGAWQGFTTHIARYIDRNLTVIVLTNSANGGPTAIAHKAAGIILSDHSAAGTK